MGVALPSLRTFPSLDSSIRPIALPRPLAYRLGEVGKVGKVKEHLFGWWQRKCPMCGRALERTDPLEAIPCRCGWVWN